MASTFQWAYERIYEVLIDGAGNARGLALGDRFNRGHPPGFSAQLRSVRAKERPTVFVVLVDSTPESGVSQEFAEQQLWRVIINIYRDHWLSFEGNPTTVEEQLVEAADARWKTRGALCFTGNLKETAEGRNTGIAGEALRADSSTSKLVRVDNLGNEGRLLQYLDQYIAEFEFSFESALLLEDGFNLLLEDGGRLLLE